MKTVKQIKREARHLFRWCRSNGELDEQRVRLVMQNVLTSKRRGYLAMANEFDRLVRLDQLQHSATVESATALPAELQASVQESLIRLYGEGLTTQFKENTSLIGGMRVRVGSDVYDGSVKGGLVALERTL
jgi:F-type H+-transporting ATPase subunit delta